MMNEFSSSFFWLHSDDYQSSKSRLIREINQLWHDEITKYYPDLAVMSFAGPEATIRWLIERIEETTPNKELQRYKDWVNDLQSEMYINCVYCGHRYGPNSEVPASMADVLKEHIEQCPEHPMSALKKENEELKQKIFRKGPCAPFPRCCLGYKPDQDNK